MTPRLQKIMKDMVEKYCTTEREVISYSDSEHHDGYIAGFTAGVAERDKELLEIGEEISWQDGTAFYTDVNGQRWVHETDAIGCLKQLKLKLAASNAAVIDDWITRYHSIKDRMTEKEKELAALVDAKNWAIDMASSYRDECEQLRTLWECHGDKLQWGPLQNANKIRDERLSDEDVISLSKQLLAKDKELASLREENETCKALRKTEFEVYQDKLQAQDALLRECLGALGIGRHRFDYDDLIEKLTTHLENK